MILSHHTGAHTVYWGLQPLRPNLETISGAVAALMAATPSMSLSAASALTTAIEMAAVAPMSLVTAPALTTAIQMRAAPAMSLVTASALQTAIEMAATAPMSLVAVAALTTAIQMQSAPAMSLTTAAALTAFGDLIKSNVATAISATSTADLGSNPKSGNLLLATFGNDVSGTAITTPPSGFTELHEESTGGGAAWVWYYKISDGTEQTVQIVWAGSGDVAAHYAEYEWGGSTPTVTKNENTDNVSTVVNAQPSGAVTPVSANNIVIAAHGTDAGQNNFDNQAVNPGTWFEDTFFEEDLNSHFKLSRLVNATGSQEATHTDDDITGDQMYGAIASFDRVLEILLAAISSMSLSSSPSLTTAIQMASTAPMSLVSVSALTTAIRLASAPEMSLTSVAALTTAIEMQAAPVMSLASASALTTAIRMATTVPMALTAASALATAIQMQADPAMSLNAAIALSTAIEMAAGPTDMTLNVAAALTLGATFAAPVDMSLISAALLQTSIEMKATPSMSIISSATLATAITMQAAPAMTLNAAPALTTAIELAAALTMSLNIAANLQAGSNIAAAASMSLSANTALQTAIEMAAAGTLSLNAAAALTTSIELAVVNAMSLVSAASLTTAIDLSAAPSLSLIVSPTLVVPTGILGGIFNAVSHFGTGLTVTIVLKDPVTGDPISLSTDVCNEIGSFGMYIWDGVNLTTPVTGYQEYAWQMTDGTNFNDGVIRMFDSADSTKLLEIWRRLALDPDNPLTNKADGGISATGIDIVGDGPDTGPDIIQDRS